MSRHLPEPEELSRILAPLLEQGRSPVAGLGIDDATLRELGFEVAEGVAAVPSGVERLDEQLIRACLSERARDWVVDLVMEPIVGSTSTILNDQVGIRPVHGAVRLAELQIQGRGRRGRDWISPYGNNLAMSVGAHLPQTPDQLGGFSLSMGLAVADLLEGTGVEGVELKWPNDVLVGGSKIAGILIELHSCDAGTEVVIGVGVNFLLPIEARAAIDQPVTDLHETGRSISRNRLAGGLISSLVDFIDGFAERGFPPMRESFDRAHRFHDQTCVLHLGNETVTGIVRGVGDGGDLLLELDGQLRSFSAGEVSLRPAGS